MEFLFGLGVVTIIFSKSFELVTAQGSSETADAGLYSGFSSSVITFDDYRPLKTRSYAEFQTPESSPSVASAITLKGRSYAEFPTPVGPTEKEATPPATSANKLSSRTYAEFHTRQTETPEKQFLSVITPVYESMMMNEANEKHAIKDTYYTVDNGSFVQDPNSKINYKRPSFIVQRSTRHFLNVLADHDLVRTTLPRQPVTQKRKIQHRGILDILLPPSRLKGMKGALDYFRGLLSSTF